MTGNPYRLARDIRGIGFKTADVIAAKLGIEKTAMVRVRAGISFALTEAMGRLLTRARPGGRAGAHGEGTPRQGRAPPSGTAAVSQAWLARCTQLPGKPPLLGAVSKIALPVTGSWRMRRKR